MGVKSSLSLISIFTILDYEWSSLLYVFLIVTFFAPLIVLCLISFLGFYQNYKPKVLTARIYSFCHAFCMMMSLLWVSL